MRVIPIFAAALGLAGIAVAASDNGLAPAGATYTEDGHLRRPDGYREWVYLSSGLDMNYRERPMGMNHSMFDNVFVEPAAYREFLKTGTWPDKTILVMEVRGASNKGSINKSGQFQTAGLMGMEAHVKDSTRFPGGWAFFAFDDAESAAPLPQEAACYACHREHGAVDTTFVQFYPTLLGLAEQKHTLSQAYLADESKAKEGAAPDPQ